MKILPIKDKIVKSSGFTLIELVVVIGMLAILFAITLVAINPARQFANARDSQRRSDINAILDSVHEYAANNGGKIPSIIPTTPTIIGNGSGEIDLCSDLVPEYIADLPIDPSRGSKTPANNVCTVSGTTYDTGYYISAASGSGRLTVTADGEETPVISVTR